MKQTSQSSLPSARRKNNIVMRALIMLFMCVLTTIEASALVTDVYCSFCRDTYQKVTVIIDREPDCVNRGHAHAVCPICRKNIEDECFTIDLSFLEPLGHDWRTDTYGDPTCTQPGGTVQTCNRCGLTQGGTPALGHEWDEYNICSRCNTPNGDITLAHDADNCGKITRLTSLGSIDVTLSGSTLYCNGSWNTLCLPFSLATLAGTPLEGFTVKELDTESAHGGHHTGLNGTTLYLNFKDATGIEAGKPYIVKRDNTPFLAISSDDGWIEFATNVNNGTEDYAGKIVRLAANINVSATVGTSEHPFCGTFDGDGYTLSLDITDIDNQGTAPFRYISGATIMNVKTLGTVTGNLHCAGLVGFAKDGTNYIRNSHVAASVVCSGGSHSHCGGILGHGLTSNTTISDCLFSGSISGTTTATGIIYGWGDSGGSHTIVNCVSSGTYTGCSGVELIKMNGGTESITNCYRLTAGGSQGADASSLSRDQLASALGAGWDTVVDNLVPRKFIDVIQNPKFTGITVSNTSPAVITSQDGKISFTGSYGPVASTDGKLFDQYNTAVDNSAFHNYLTIQDPEPAAGYTYGGCYTDVDCTDAPTVIPFGAGGSFRLYARMDLNTYTLDDGTAAGADALAGLVSQWQDKQVQVSLSRSFYAGRASTICLPFPMESITGGKVYQFVDVSYDSNDGWVATMQDATPEPNLVSTTSANTPYLFLPDADGPVTFSGTITSVPASMTAGTSDSGDWSFHGTYSRQEYGTAPFSGSVFGFAATSGKSTDGVTDVTAGQFVKATTGAYIQPFRAYLTYSGSNSALQAPARGTYAAPSMPDRITVRLIDKEGTPTAVGTIETATGQITIEKWYHLSGKPVDGTPTAPGMYLDSNGRKVLIAE